MSKANKTPVTPGSGKKRKRCHEGPDEEDEGEKLDYSDEEGGFRIDDIYIPPPPKPACSVENTGPRLIITKIVNEFFKSYAGEQVLGPFHKCFNAIVGPNGSGKSNVIDSMLFVFGYRASKIRSKKISVLIHNSEKYPNVQSCTVAVHFAQILDKEGDAYEIVPGTEFYVSRTASKDNSSFYQLNGKRVQFKEIAVLLKKHNIDLDHNRFLILQGEVEQISLMKPKAQNEHETGMLEYLEDIIETSRYKKPLEKLQERVEILNEQRSEKVNRLKLVENEMKELKGPMEDAISFLRSENNLIECKNLLFQKHINILEKKINDTDEKKQTVEEELTALENKFDKLKKEKCEKEKELLEKQKTFEDWKKKKEAMKAAFDKADNLDIKIQADIEQVNKTRKTNKKLLKDEEKKLEEYKILPEKNRKEIAEYEAKEIDLNKKKEAFEEEKVKILASLRNETQELQEKKEILQTELIDLNKAVDETKSAFTLAESELKLCLSNEESEVKKLESLRETYETVKNTMQERGEEINLLKKKIPATEKSLREATNDLQKAKTEEAQLIDEVRKKRALIEERKSSMQASKSRGRVLDSLMQQKREGKCPGLFGRLGDLGAIDQKYDVAISTACGPLDNIVVDTVDTAQWCIEFLKQYDIGRATFIALEKQEHLWEYANSRIKTPEHVPRLYDLIKIEDERVKTAFYYALRDTLVAENLEQASRIAYGAQRYRVVTLNGDLIETSGTMSGGGKTVLKGRMGQSVTVSTSQAQTYNIEEMESNLQELEQLMRQLRQKQSQLESQVNTLNPQLRQMKIDLEKYTIELQSLKQQLPVLQKQLSIQEKKTKETKSDPVQVKKLKNIVQVKKDAYDAAIADTVEIQERVNAITKEIKDKTAGKMKAMDKKLNDVIITIDKCKAEITRLNVGIKTAERNATKSAEKISTLEADIKKSEETLVQLANKRKEIENDAAQLLKGIKELSEKITENEEDYNSIKKSVNELTKKENALKSEKIEIDQRFKSVMKVLDEQKAEIHQWRAKLAQLKLQEIPNETMEPLKTYTSEELDAKDLNVAMKEMHNKEEKLKSMKPNLNSIAEYCKKRSIYVERADELVAVTEKRNQMKEMHDTLRSRRKDEFIVGYNIIRLKLKEMYQLITLGGDADFEMVDTFDPFTEGIQLNVRPPKKSWKNISNLSGGEKTLSSLALVFALHYYKPSPLYVMDEIDAALDFKNVSIVGNYIKERTKNAQFIIISLRANMFELCDYLIGIYKTFDCTKSICIDPRMYDNENHQVINRAAVNRTSTENKENKPSNNQVTSTRNNHSTTTESDQVMESESSSAHNSIDTSNDEIIENSIEEMDCN